MTTKIQNIDELRAEVIRLGVQRTEIESDFKLEFEKITSKIRGPFMLLRKLNNFLGGSKDESGKKDGEDWVSSIFRIGLPVMMNRFLFPKSGIIVKYIVELISQNAAKTVNKDLLIDLLDKLSEWIKTPTSKRKKEPELADYGIPPDSETY
jgi:hypothetical protein